MVKMAYALPKLVPIAMSNMSNMAQCPNNMTKTTLSEVLQSDPVKRLLNQPNIVVKALPPLTLIGSPITKKDIFESNKNGINTNLNNNKPSDISVVPLRRLSDEKQEDANLLPSKIEDKKSEITLLPVRKKVCGHYEPCENIVCNVALQQHMDQDGISFMLAMNIEEDEINAPVAKHCKNKYCDALSIDHNRCRRAMVKLHRYDKSSLCDICGAVVKSWKSRIYHKSCKRKDEYRHNNVDRTHLLKERMRELELQMLEATKMKTKNDYLDPVKGYDLAMETLRKNEELIIIPKTVPSPSKPITTITSVSNVQLTNTNPSNVNQSVNINSQTNNLTNTVGNISLILSRPNNATRPEQSKTQPMNQVKLNNIMLQNLQSIKLPVSTTRVSTTRVSTTPISIRSISTTPISTIPISTTPISTTPISTTPISTTPISTTSTSTTPISTTLISTETGRKPITTKLISTTPVSIAPLILPQNQYVRIATQSQKAIQPITINNWVMSPSHVLTTTSIQPKSLLTPIRVVPITNLVSAPSLLHRTQGVPKFCIMTADSVITPLPNPPPLQPVTKIQPVQPIANITTQQKVKIPIQACVRKQPKAPKETRRTPKRFFCVYCAKYFSTDWYFKIHVAKHRSDKHIACNFCNDSFNNKFDMNRHMIKKHKNQKKLAHDNTSKSHDFPSSRLVKSNIEIYAKPSSDKTDEILRNGTHKTRKCILDSKGISTDKTKKTKLLHNSNGIDVKKLKGEDKSLDSKNGSKDTSVNGIKVKLQQFEPSKSTYIKEPTNKKSLVINGADNAKKKEYIILSITKNPENFEKKTLISFR